MNFKDRLIRVFNSKSLLDLFSTKEQSHTRKINPKLGLLGFLGFAGLSGFLFDISPTTIPFPCFFFAFFGFFGFYYEGKMSNTLIDERFKTNSYKAEALANKIALSVIIFVTIFILGRINNLDTLLLTLISTIGIAFGLSAFLQQYLLYKFENEE
ncbi:MAG: DUF3796 domain-containing protein [Sarcina sp.]